MKVIADTGLGKGEKTLDPPVMAMAAPEDVKSMHENARHLKTAIAWLFQPSLILQQLLKTKCNCLPHIMDNQLVTRSLKLCGFGSDNQEPCLH